MKVWLTLAAYLAALVAAGVVAFSGVIALAGPHGGLLPETSQPAVLTVGWLAVLVVPVWVARRVWAQRRNDPPE